MGKKAIAETLRQRGMTASVSTVGRVIARHCFFFADLPSHRQKRINAGLQEPEMMPSTPSVLPSEPSANQLPLLSLDPQIDPPLA